MLKGRLDLQTLVGPVTVAVLGIVALLAGYGVYETFNVFDTFAAVLFFYGLLWFLAGWPLKPAVQLTLAFLKRPLGWLVFFTYLVLHYFLYGFLLEKFLVSLYGYRTFPSSPALYITSVPFTPESVWNGILTLTSYPSIEIWVPPYYGMVLIPYGIFMGLVIAILVTANVAVVRDMAASCPVSLRSKAYVVLPSAGIVSGASCCLSIPILLELAVPATGALTLTAAASYIAYYLFPPATALALFVLFRQSLKLKAHLSEAPP